ncbi:hypothetical protein SCLCIDRAFT_32253 [Scleroderma citrinum Foug A]|uniref:Uncharacterized protein n=1 Tax=Scleroderma citrinum Foug A TaxID=1036808 RepID=A0A0C2ZJU4_9AGAM|nr:hypothetical protein SCLCIDRAFT_32253 [Scleroderma citrinum Foug A]
MSKDLIHFQTDGWITHLIIPRGHCPEIDLSNMAHGPAWHKCYTPVLNDN